MKGLQINGFKGLSNIVSNNYDNKCKIMSVGGQSKPLS